jgi:hypothetical protein
MSQMEAIPPATTSQHPRLAWVKAKVDRCCAVTAQALRRLEKERREEAQAT